MSESTWPARRSTDYPNFYCVLSSTVEVWRPTVWPVRGGRVWWSTICGSNEFVFYVKLGTAIYREDSVHGSCLPTLHVSVSRRTGSSAGNWARYEIKNCYGERWLAQRLGGCDLNINSVYLKIKWRHFLIFRIFAVCSSVGSACCPSLPSWNSCRIFLHSFSFYPLYLWFRWVNIVKSWGLSIKLPSFLR